MKNKNTTGKKWNLGSYTTRPKPAPAAIGIILLVSLSVATNGVLFVNSNNVLAQVNQQDEISPSANKITIHVNSIKFAPLIDTNYNQIKVLVNYQTNGPFTENTPMT
ncbi:hypothetical protein BH23THE1_BH23THE1_28810 [soil metagenome]